MTKVILAISTGAPFDEVTKVRKYLSGLDCQVVEAGLMLTEQQIHAADIIIVVGSSNPEDGLISVDKAVYDLVEGFMDDKWDSEYDEFEDGNNNVLFVSSIDEHVYVDELSSREEPHGGPYARSYGSFYTNEAEINLSSYIGPRQQGSGIHPLSGNSSADSKAPMLYCARSLNLI